MRFTKLRFKNFLSFGNKITEVELDQNKTVLITGENGAGKTTTLEAFYFVMTGKPFRKIKKEELINSTNKKDLLVELEFTHDNANFLIKRGIKPNIFEIYKNDQLIEQDAATKDYQQILENILGLDSNTLGQSIFISSKNYTPFLKLNAAEKRNFVENVLDIKIFSNILEQLKIKRTIHKEAFQQLEFSLKNNKDKLNIANESNEKHSQGKEKDIENLKSLIVEAEKELTKIDNEITNIDKYIAKEDFDNKIFDYNKQIENIQTSISKTDLEISTKKSITIDIEENLRTVKNKANNDKSDIDNQIKSIEHKSDLRQMEILSQKVDIDNQIKIIDKDYSNLIYDIEKDRERGISQQESQTNNLISNCESIINEAQSQIDFLKHNAECPKCKQSIDQNSDIISEQVKKLSKSVIDNKRQIEQHASSLVEFIKAIRAEATKKIDDELEKKNKSIDSLQEQKNKVSEEGIKDKENRNDEIKKLEKEKNGIDQQLTKDVDEHTQKIADNETYIETLNEDLESFLVEIKTIQNQIDEINKSKNLAMKRKEQLIQVERFKYNDKIEHYNNNIQSIKESTKPLIDIQPIQSEIDEYIKLIEQSEYKKETIEMLIKMLGDKGLKSYIIKKYIPTLNELVNKYLDIFGANYRITFDEMFDIQIHARGYEKLRYGSFSSGEEQRVDISLLFSFIELGRLKNSINTNILLLDEISDKSLDSVGLDGLFMMFEDMKRKGMNIFNITHRPELKDRFDLTYEVTKVNNFSQLNIV